MTQKKTAGEIRDSLNSILKKKGYERLAAPIAGSGRFPEGRTRISVANVDTKDFFRGFMISMFKSVDKNSQNTHKQLYFVLTKDKSQLSRDFKSFLEGLFGDPEFIDIVTEQFMLKNPEDVAHILRGMKVEVDMVYRSGYDIIRADLGYMLLDTKTSSYITDRGFNSVKEARAYAQGKGLKRAQIEPVGYAPFQLPDGVYTDELNRKAFLNAIDALDMLDDTEVYCPPKDLVEL